MGGGVLVARLAAVGDAATLFGAAPVDSVRLTGGGVLVARLIGVGDAATLLNATRVGAATSIVAASDGAVVGT